MKKSVIIIDPKNDIRPNIEEQIKTLEDMHDFFWLDDLTLVPAMIEKHEVEIILVDFSLEKNGDVIMLNRIKRDYPQIYIVVFVSPFNKMNINDMYRLAHLILEIPCNFTKLVYCFSRRAEMIKYLNDSKLMGLINKITDLPTVPETYFKLDKEIASGNYSIQKISSILSEDLSFTVKILHIVNSPFFGLKYKITNVLQAVSLLGINIIKSLLLYHHTFSNSRIDLRHKKYFEDMWLHSNQVGRIAHQILYFTNKGELELMEEAYIAGLLHDIGKVVMLQSTEYPDLVFKYMEEHNARYSDAEYSIYGASHSEIGAYFLSLWGLPNRTTEAVYLHNNQNNIDFTRFSVVNAVFIANLISQDETINLEELMKLNLGVSPKDWINYLEDHKLKKSNSNDGI